MRLGVPGSCVGSSLTEVGRAGDALVLTLRTSSDLRTYSGVPGGGRAEDLPTYLGVG